MMEIEKSNLKTEVFEDTSNTERGLILARNVLPSTHMDYIAIEALISDDTRSTISCNLEVERGLRAIDLARGE